MTRPVLRLLDAAAKAVLGSPLHFLISWQSIVIEYTGVKTGKPYRTGANYVRRGNVLHCMTYRRRVWWRNLRDDRPVTVLYRGRRWQGTASVEEHDLAVISAGLDERELPRRLLYRARPEQSVLVRIELSGAPPS